MIYYFNNSQHLPNHSNSQHIELRLSTSQFGSGLYPTRTKLDHFEFPRSGPATNQKEGSNRASQVFSGNSQLSIGVEEERLGRNWLDLVRSRQIYQDLNQIWPDLPIFDRKKKCLSQRRMVRFNGGKQSSWLVFMQQSANRLVGIDF